METKKKIIIGSVSIVFIIAIIDLFKNGYIVSGIICSLAALMIILGNIFADKLLNISGGKK